MADSTPNEDLDLTFLYEIADGSNEFIIESIDMLLQQAPDLLNNIQTAIQLQDWPAAAASAHKLKPSMGFFGMLNSQELLQELEQLCKAGPGDAELVRSKFSRASELINANMQTLTRVRAEKESEL
ncbi:MAG TPA: Hpt domain-containing protein [Mucilaginibacter sp.]|nr:Hpt domain-containing protein [Mucilaginibacter sp.]HVW14188.1 Hpt domain-containing protein [Mucilaginibacter sp.]